MARNLILTGGIYHPFEEAAAALADILRPLGIESDIVLDIEDGVARLDNDYALLTNYALRWRMLNHEKYAPYRAQWAISLSAAGRRRISDFVAGGGAVLAMHTASICFDDWPGWRELLGGAWAWGKTFHPPPGPFTVAPCDGHPIVQGLAPFTIRDELYHHLDVSAAAMPLLTAVGEGDAGRQIIAWAHGFGRGRVVYDSLGHDPASLQTPGHRQFLRQAAAWLTQSARESQDA